MSHLNLLQALHVTIKYTFTVSPNTNNIYLFFCFQNPDIQLMFSTFKKSTYLRQLTVLTSALESA